MKKVLSIITLGIALQALLLVSCGKKDDAKDKPTKPTTEELQTEPIYFVITNDTLSIHTGDTMQMGDYAATSRIVDDTVFYYLIAASKLNGSGGVKWPAASLTLRYDPTNFWQVEQAAMYENFDHASALTEANNGSITFDWLKNKTLRSIVENYNKDDHQVSLVLEIDMFNLYELYFGNEEKTVNDVHHKNVIIALTDVVFAPLGF